MKRIFIVLLLVKISIAGFGQKTRSIDSLSIKFLFPFSMVADSSQLTLHVVYKNNIKNYVSIYGNLVEAGKGNRFANIAIEMEKQEKKEYKHHFLNCTASAPYSLVDSLRHYDLPKKQLASYASDTLTLDLLKVAGSFLPGRYRFRAHLRVNTKRDDREYNDPNFETPPPYDTIEYISSRWIYFTVKNLIHIQMLGSKNSLLKLSNQSASFFVTNPIRFKDSSGAVVSVRSIVELEDTYMRKIKSRYGKELVQDLVFLLNDPERDWAANVMLYAISEASAVTLKFYNKDKIEEWRAERKQADMDKWKDYLQVIKSIQE